MPKKHPVFGDRPLPPVAGSCSGTVMVVGTARCVLEDMEAVWGSRCWQEPPADMMGVNHMGSFLPKMKHWLTCHPKSMGAWEGMRLSVPGFGPLDGYQVHTNGQPLKDMVGWNLEFKAGRNAGLAAAVIGVALGYDEVILTGLPGDGTGHFYPTSENHLNLDYGGAYNKSAWEFIRDEYLDGKVVSASGKTKELLGGPAVWA